MVFLVLCFMLVHFCDFYDKLLNLVGLPPPRQDAASQGNIVALGWSQVVLDFIISELW